MKRLLFSFLICCVAGRAMAQKTYIQCGRIIDGVSDKERKTVTIITEGKKILDIKDGYLSGGSSDSIVDLKNKTVMPGFIDCHVHLEFQISKTSFMDGFRLSDADIAFQSAIYARRTLMAGFTTVRDLGGTGVNIALRNAIDRGLTEGPHILTAGKAISASGGHMDPSVGIREDAMRKNPGPEEGVADGKDECIKAVRYQFKAGADLIKIASTGGVLDLSTEGSGAEYSVEEIKAITETANDYGMRVACHAHGAEGIKRAILGGVNSIEHGTFMDDEDMALMKQHNVWYVPTLTAGRSVGDSAKVPGYFVPVVAAKASVVGPTIQKTFAKAWKAGVKVAFGTDAGVFPHGKNYLEFQFMTEAGMSPMDAIKSATTSAAELLGIKEERGSLQAGKIADIVAVAGNPLQDITTLGNMVFIMKEGKIYKK